MAFGDADVLLMLGPPFGVDVAYGAATTTGIFSETESVADFGGFTPQMQRYTTEALDVTERRVFVFVAATAFEGSGALVGLSEGDALTVDGRSYQAREFGPTEDGRLWRVTLVGAS